MTMEEIIKEELEEIQSLCPTGYKIKDLEKQDQDMIWNAAWMIIHAEADDTEDCEEDTILEKMVKEIKRSAEDEIKLSLRISASEMVVALLDSYEEVSE